MALREYAKENNDAKRTLGGRRGRNRDRCPVRLLRHRHHHQPRRGGRRRQDCRAHRSRAGLRRSGVEGAEGAVGHGIGAPAPAPEPGTRENPGVVGSDVGTFSSGPDSIDVTVEAATWDANAIVAGENQFNDPPADGMVYVIVPLTVTYSGPESMLPWLDVDVTYLAENGRSYEQAYVVIPDDLRDVADIYDGGSATGNIIFELPADQVPGGLWGVSYHWSDPLWWAAS